MSDLIKLKKIKTKPIERNKTNYMRKCNNNKINVKSNTNTKSKSKPNANQKNKSKHREVVVIDLSSESDHSTRVKGKEKKKVNEIVANGHQSVPEEEDSTEEDESTEEESDAIEETKKPSNLKFKFCGSVKSDLEKPLYGVQFNTYLPEGQNYFATVGSTRTTVYECLTNGSIRLVQCYAEDNPKEDLFTCCWSFEAESGHPLVISAGKVGIINVIDCDLKEEVRHLTGHGCAINDLKVSPFDPNLLLSASQDCSLRLWNLKTSVCVVRFGGDSGHRDQVICADFYLLSNRYIVSTGMDHSIKIWSLDKPDIQSAIKDSYEHNNEEKSFAMEWQHFPVFTTRKVHSNYVDCVQFFGRFLLSKSCDNEIVCSKPNRLDSENGFSNNQINEDITLIDRFELIDSNFWFIKFSMDCEQRLLSVGNNIGVTYVWDMTVDQPFDYEPLVLQRPKCRHIIRQTSFSSDGTILICVCDDSTIWRWNIDRS